MSNIESTVLQVVEKLEELASQNDSLWFNQQVLDQVNVLRQALDQPKQEPVAWLDEERNIFYMHNTHKTDDYHGFKRTTPLYIEPPKHEWVGLTEEEVRAIDTSEFWNDHTPLDFARAIEAKLKERNA